MKNTIVLLEDKSLKSVAFTDDLLIVSSKEHKSMDSLLASVEKSKLLETVKKIPLIDIISLARNEASEVLTVHYHANEKSKSLDLSIEDDGELVRFMEDLAAQRGLSKSITEEQKNKPLLTNIGIILLVIFFTWLLREMAIDADNGEVYEATGRRSGMKNLIAKIAAMLGPIGVLGLGAAVVAFLGFKTYKRFNSPAAEITYS